MLLRTFSKAYGLAGLRVGYGVASDASLIDVMDRARTPFNVNRLAQAGALAALGEADYMRECVSRTVEERERVRAELEKLGYHAAPSVANFLFFDAREDAAELAGRLLRHGVIVKPWREAGFSGHVRVSIGSTAANNQFLAAIAREGNADRTNR
jgi:histidinol-phosphate aminotransferase